MVREGRLGGTLVDGYVRLAKDVGRVGKGREASAAEHRLKRERVQSDHRDSRAEDTPSQGLHGCGRCAPRRHQNASRMPPTKLRGAPANTEPVVLARTLAPLCRPEVALIEFARFWAEAM
ncbi:hypothetical protein SAMN02799625_05421 [Methylobacterium sp. UNC300MFChir4.1]|nr:hypothetical protein SAMN02799625_05421 [Methylobacterium sp. UNC300MFChir4.1]